MKKDVLSKFESYPDNIQPLMYELRTLVYEVAKEDGIENLQESLKWGEPTYTCPKGSPFRIDWKEKEPGVYAMYFHCQTRLVSTFKELYPNTFNFSGNRAIVLQVGENVPAQELKHCISLALRYHSLKDKPLLGA